MIRISILYPSADGARFDFPYFVEHHIPLSIEALGAHPGFRGVSVERVLGTAVPGTKAPYIAICHYLFTSTEDFLAAYLPHSTTLQRDMPNYTDIGPIILVNEVLVSNEALGAKAMSAGTP